MNIELTEQDLTEISALGDPYQMESTKAAFDLWVVAHKVGEDI